MSALAALAVVFVLLGGCSHIQKHIEEYRESPSTSLYDPTALPPGQLGEAIRYGHDVFVDPHKYMKANVTARMSCEACHLNGATKDRAGSLVGTYARFPQYNNRAHRIIALQDRLAECFLYSMNGTPPAYNSREMIAMVAYIAWLSRGVPTLAQLPASRYATVTLPATPPNVAHGSQIYTQKCEACHQANGAGAGQYPPLWGPTSFADKAGMSTFRHMVPFVYYNMPQNAPGSLSLQDSYDVSAYVLSHKRPPFRASRVISQPSEAAIYF